jgi:hypothetical protein
MGSTGFELVPCLRKYICQTYDLIIHVGQQSISIQGELCSLRGMGDGREANAIS